MKKLKITHLNTYYPVGGAGKFTQRLVLAHRAMGHDPHVVSVCEGNEKESIHSFDPAPDPDLSQTCPQKGLLDYQFQGSHCLMDQEPIRSSDLVHCSNLHGGYFNPWSISALSSAKPLVWTLHDMQAITGHCAHSLNCTKWKTGCGQCPDLEIYPGISVDSTAQLYRDKQAIYDHSFLQIVTPADWLRKKVQQGILRDHPVELIYNGCNTGVFKPYNKAEVRRHFKIPQDAFVVGAVAHGGTLGNPWKGGWYTKAVWEAAVKILPGGLFLNIGAEYASEGPSIFNIKPVQDEYLLALLYNAMDVFLYTPAADTCPLVVIETLACGVPIITYNTGGIPELVRDQVDGFVFPQGRIDPLVTALKTLYEKRDLLKKMGVQARQSALERFTVEKMAAQYLALYYRWMERHRRQVRTLRYFDMSRVPDVIKTEAFMTAEQTKKKIETAAQRQEQTPEFSVVDHPEEFTYSKKRHFELFQSASLELYGETVDPATCDLKRYQDLLVFEFIKRHVPKGSRILDVGGGDSRILNHFYRDYECWNIDPLEGAGSGLKQLDPKGRYKLVQDYMGRFNPQLPSDYFDFVFSISALEHAGEDAQTLENIRNDINRVLRPGGYSFHLFDCVIKPDRVWIHRLVPSLFSSQTTANRWVEPEALTADPELYTMTKAAYEGGWMSVTKEPYETFGKPFSYQVLWQKSPVPTTARTTDVQSPAASVRPSAKPRMPKITVVTPSYNQAPYLEACIQSVLNQAYPNLEYIIMDGGSTDGSVEIIKKYAPYLAYWQSRPDGGQYKAVEDGFARSTGEIMTWLNSDDQYFPDAFEVAAAVFSERPDIDWLTGRVVNFNEDGSVKLIREDIPLWCRAKYLKKDYRSPYLQQEGTFWRRSLWEKAGSCMRTDLHLAGDLELWNRFFRHADLHTLDAALAGYRLQPNRKIATLLERYHQEADRILDEELNLYLNQPVRPELTAPPPPLPATELCRYRNAFRRKHAAEGGEKSATFGIEPMALGTSLAPGNIENQQKAVQSWLDAGFLVLSVNTPEEIGKLRPLFPRVCFVVTSRNGREIFGKPMIYIDDIFGALKETQFEIVGIINSDIHLSPEPVHLDAIAQQTKEAVVCVNRMNVKRLGGDNATIFVDGFDVFFFRRAMLERIPASRFCLGVAWWDYYVPIVCVLNQIPLVCFQDPIAYHIWHSLNWDKNQWTHAAKYFFERLLDLCGQRKGYNPFGNLGHKFREAWKLYHLIALNGYPIAIIHKSYIYAEFIMGIVCGQMKVLDALVSCGPEGKNPFALPDPKTITQALMSPSMTLVAINAAEGPLVSAIVSTYESEAFIGGCLQDLVEQTLYQKGLLEIIVVDSASPQNEGAIVRDFQSRYPNIRYVRSPQRETIYAAWNRGIREARGKYITNANTDDRHAPQMLEMLAAVLEEDPEKAAVYSHFYITETPHQTWKTKTPERLANWHPPFSRLDLLKGNFMGPQPMWRRSLHDEYGYFDPSFRVSGDWEFFVRVSQTHSFVLCKNPLGLYYHNPKSLERSAGTREKEDLFIRRFYAKNWNTVVRRPFHPETDSAFPETAGLPGPQAQAGPDPLISVCLVAYNTGPYIARAIDSVLCQTYPNFELIIVDDGSTDRTASLIGGYTDPRIRAIRQEHKNFAAGMNRAIQAARGEFVIGVDSDDFVDPDYLKKMADFAARNPEFDYYFPEKLTLVDAQGHRTGIDWAYEEVQDSGRLLATLFAKGFSVIPNSGSLKRRSMFEKTGPFRELDNVEDFDFLTRCARQIRFKKVIGSSRYYYRKIEKSNTSRFEQRNRVTADCLDRMIQTYPPTLLCPGLSEVFDPAERDGRFMDYVIAVFEKLAQTYRDRSGRIFETYAEKYRQKKSGLSGVSMMESPIIQGTLQNQLSLAQVHLEQGDWEKAAGIYRQILSNKNLPIHTDLRRSLETMIEKLETGKNPVQKICNVQK